MNKYEIIGIVGEGAYGIVYKAKNKDTGAFGKYNNTILLHIMENGEIRSLINWWSDFDSYLWFWNSNLINIFLIRFIIVAIKKFKESAEED